MFTKWQKQIRHSLNSHKEDRLLSMTLRAASFTNLLLFLNTMKIIRNNMQKTKLFKILHISLYFSILIIPLFIDWKYCSIIMLLWMIQYLYFGRCILTKYENQPGKDKRFMELDKFFPKNPKWDYYRIWAVVQTLVYIGYSYLISQISVF
jgi:hypothetical protein